MLIMQYAYRWLLVTIVTNTHQWAVQHSLSTFAVAKTIVTNTHQWAV